MNYLWDTVHTHMNTTLGVVSASLGTNPFMHIPLFNISSKTSKQVLSYELRAQTYVENNKHKTTASHPAASLQNKFKSIT